MLLSVPVRLRIIVVVVVEGFLELGLPLVGHWCALDGWFVRHRGEVSGRCGASRHVSLVVSSAAKRNLATLRGDVHPLGHTLRTG